jgi:hypothetical protein
VPAKAVPPTYEEASADRLRDLDPDTIENMQIVQMRPWEGDMHESTRYDLDKRSRDALLMLLRKAEKRPPGMEEVGISARLRVFLKDGSIFQVSYFEDLDQAFGQWKSRPFREALWALSHGSHLTAIRIQDEKVTEVVVAREVPRANNGVHSGQPYAVSLDLDAAGALVCHLRLGPAQQPTLVITHEVSYGKAFTVPARDGKGFFVILFEMP